MNINAIKLKKLESILKDMGKVAVAYSGGVDSTFLLKIARSVLGKKNVIAAIGVSESYPHSERLKAEKMAKDMDVPYKILRTRELDNKKFAKNPVDRCFHCKMELFSKIKAAAGRHGISTVADGSNSDDLKDLRYGRAASRRLSVRSPLIEAGLGKGEIRDLSRRMGLPTWDKPSLACLASRLSYNQAITKEKLRKIGAAEDFLRGLGFNQVRARYHAGDILRIEVDKSAICKIANRAISQKISKKMKSLGFTYITLDLEGFRTGSMNEGLRLHSHSRKY